MVCSGLILSKDKHWDFTVCINLQIRRIQVLADAHSRMQSQQRWSFQINRWFQGISAFQRFEMRLLRKVLRLSASDQRLLLKGAAVVIMVRLGLWLLPFRYVRSMLAERSKSCGGPGSRATVLLRRVIWAVRVSSRYVPEATCLTQALAANFLLARSGYRSQLRIGVAKNEYGQLDAHAWVECDGRIVMGSLPYLSRYSLLPPLDALPRKNNHKLQERL